MDFLALTLEWDKIFYPQKPLLETIIRGSAVYLSLFFMLRFVMKREAGALGITDLLVIVLLADAAQNAMADDYNSITDGILLVATIIGWSMFLNFLGFKSRSFEKVIKPPKLPLIKNGSFLKENMEKELITKEELMSEIRLQGIKDIKEISEAFIEPDGAISIIEKTKIGNKKKSPPKKKRLL